MTVNTLIRTMIAGSAVAIALSAHAETLIDPTRPAAYAPTRSASTAQRVVEAPRVTAIFQTNGKRVAVFDGRVVKAGDQVGNVTIQEVLVDGVRLSRAGRVETLRLPQQAAAVRSENKDRLRKASIREEISP
jgi:MSHA biogenesis protein MshK